jgi:hypothetical protein
MMADDPIEDVHTESRPSNATNWDDTNATLLWEARLLEAEATSLFRQADEHERSCKELRASAQKLHQQASQLRESAGWITRKTGRPI